MPVGTPLRNIRVAEATWQQWRVHAEARGMSVSELVREAVAVYLSDQPTSVSSSAAVKPAVAPAQTAQSRACGSFKPTPGNALRCLTCGERYGAHV